MKYRDDFSKIGTALKIIWAVLPFSTMAAWLIMAASSDRQNTEKFEQR
jgi:hypothetical protein